MIAIALESNTVVSRKKPAPKNKSKEQQSTLRSQQVLEVNYITSDRKHQVLQRLIEVYSAEADLSL